VRMKGSPSLRKYLEDELQAIYTRAVQGAAFETGVKPVHLPKRCPFTLEQLLA
jgi:hypothetical protein